jgi:hypothetical protein
VFTFLRSDDYARLKDRLFAVFQHFRSRKGTSRLGLGEGLNPYVIILQKSRYAEGKP